MEKIQDWFGQTYTEGSSQSKDDEDDNQLSI